MSHFLININEYIIPGSAPVLMAIYVPGNEVNMLINQSQPAGVHQVIRDVKNQAGQVVLRGFYFVKIKCGQFLAIRECLNLNQVDKLAICPTLIESCPYPGAETGSFAGCWKAITSGFISQNILMK